MSSLVDGKWEDLDPNPDIHSLFVTFNREYFWNKLGRVEVKWSPKMTLCAGLCRYRTNIGECTICLSKPLLSLRPRRDLIETLLHEMIHAYLFVAEGNREREAHGESFHFHMNRINKLTGAKITVYHSFHDEVAYYKTHWWKCNGPCQHRSPFYGIVKRSMNRAPGPNDFWFADHKNTCNGTFVKIKEPEKKPKKDANNIKKPKLNDNEDKNKQINTLDNYFDKSIKSPAPVQSQSNNKHNPVPLKTQTTNTLDNYFSKLGSGQSLGSASALSTPKKRKLQATATATSSSATSSSSSSSSTTTLKTPAPDNNLFESNNVNYVNCPICYFSIPEIEINDHLDVFHLNPVQDQDLDVSIVTLD